jgi:hypothetical protein
LADARRFLANHVLGVILTYDLLVGYCWIASVYSETGRILELRHKFATLSLDNSLIAEFLDKMTRSRGRSTTLLFLSTFN